MIDLLKTLLLLLVSMILVGSLLALFDGKILGGVIAGFIMGGLFLYSRSQRKGLRTTVEEIDNEKRALVIYLRSFREESNHTLMARLKESFFGITLPGTSSPIREIEQQNFAMYMNQIGVYTAIGRPGEPLPFPGAKKVYVADDEWKAVISRWIDRSAAVVLEPGRSGEGLSWEISRVVKNAKPEDVLVILPQMRSDYESVRNYLNKLLPKPIPEKVKGDIRLITFKSDWEPFPIRDLFPFFKKHGLDGPKNINQNF